MTCTEILCPAASVRGRVTPEIVNSGSLALIAEMVALLEPVLAKLISWLSDCPIVTAPNQSFDGEHVNCCACARDGTAASVARKKVKRITRIERGCAMDWGSRMFRV